MRRRHAQGVRAVDAIPVCASETLGGTAPFRDILQAQAADIIMLDVGWCGGLTEARKIAALAESLPATGRAARLQRSGGVGGLDPSHDAHSQRAGHGSSARLLLAPGTRTFSPSCRWSRTGTSIRLPGPGLGTRLLPDLLKRQAFRSGASVL